jgi:hypothetical protein
MMGRVPVVFSHCHVVVIVYNFIYDVECYYCFYGCITHHYTSVKRFLCKELILSVLNLLAITSNFHPVEMLCVELQKVCLIQFLGNS